MPKAKNTIVRSHAQIIFLINKIDLKNKRNENQYNNFMNKIMQLSEKEKCPYFEVSAKEKINVQNTIIKLSIVINII